MGTPRGYRASSTLVGRLKRLRKGQEGSLVKGPLAPSQSRQVEGCAGAVSSQLSLWPCQGVVQSWDYENSLWLVRLSNSEAPLSSLLCLGEVALQPLESIVGPHDELFPN